MRVFPQSCGFSRTLLFALGAQIGVESIARSKFVRDPAPKVPEGDPAEFGAPPLNGIGVQAQFLASVSVFHPGQNMNGEQVMIRAKLDMGRTSAWVWRIEPLEKISQVTQSRSRLVPQSRMPGVAPDPTRL